MSDEDVLEEFRIEAEELLSEAEEVLLKIESADDFPGEFNKIFRSFHSLKGAAGMFEIDDLQKFMHIIEGQFESTRSQSTMEQDQVDYFLMAIDSARKILSGEEVEFETSLFDKGEHPSENNGEENNEEKEREEKEAEKEAEKKEEKTEAENEERENKPSPLTPTIISLIDNTESSAQELSEILEDSPYCIRSFNDLSSFLQESQNISNSLILINLETSQQDIKSLLYDIRRENIKFPIFFTTTSSQEALLEEIMNDEPKGILLKRPLEKTQVLNLFHISLRHFKTWKLLEQSIDYILYQFNDLDSYLEKEEKSALRKNLRKELQEILQKRKDLIQED